MGLTGLLAAKLGAASVLLTDYEPLVSSKERDPLGRLGNPQAVWFGLNLIYRSPAAGWCLGAGQAVALAWRTSKICTKALAPPVLPALCIGWCCPQWESAVLAQLIRQLRGSACQLGESVCP